VLTRILFAVAVAGSMLLTSVPAREAACQSDPNGPKPCPFNRRCMSNTDCDTLRCNLACQLDPQGIGSHRTCLDPGTR
jgi:hypothetical protein